MYEPIFLKYEAYVTRLMHAGSMWLRVTCLALPLATTQSPKHRAPEDSRNHRCLIYPANGPCRACLAWARPGLCLRGHGPARHGIKMGRALSTHRAWDEDRINFHIFIFSINFVFLIKNLFNIIKFEIKIYDFTLNNIIKIVYIIFLLGHYVPCQANRADHRA
jgi:hypothetical protein